MIRSWSIGDAKVTSVVEYFGPTHVPEIAFPDFDPLIMATIAGGLPPGHWYPQINRFVIAVQIWILAIEDRLILVDTGVGNGKPRPAARMNMLNTLVPHWLNAAGATRENVTDVVMTHLHSDHIGWNTTFEQGRWTPMFPRARYHAPTSDFDYFNALHESGKATDTSFADSLVPVRDAGLLDLIPDHGDVAGVLHATKAFGHTPGQLNYWIESKGERGVFSADICHHPLQILSPSWNTAFCVQPDIAKATRAAFLAEAAETGALIMPCHFPPPHCGHVRRAGDGFRYEPAHR
jgi:glyoxylase-like metal-dependent hydrolase (beta-lactamase superfamily II)